VMAGYDQFGRAPTPMFEGDLAAPVPGGSGSGGALRWPVVSGGKSLEVGAGIVDGLGAGAIVALSIAEAPEMPKAFARVTEAGPARAWLEPIERGGTTFDPALVRESLLATLVERNADFRLTVARPRRDGDVAAAAVAAVLDAIAAEPETVARLVEPGEPADLVLHVEAGRLWLVGEGTRLVTSGRDVTPSMPLAATPAESTRAVKAALAGFAKARNLVKVAGLVGPGSVGGALSVEAFLARDEGLASAGAAAPDDRPCPTLQLDRLPESARPLGDAVPDLGHCDALYFRLSNGGSKPIDVTPLHVDGAGGIAYMGPPEGLRLEPGVPGRLLPLRIVTWSRKAKAPLPIGRERLLFVAVEVEGRTALPADFRYLAQAAPTTAATRGGPAPGSFRGLMERAAFGGGGTRSAAAPADLGAAGIVDFGWRVVAPDGAK
ncbi:MAG: hypothetical protein OEL76_14940, partial [Siculibacillus sp.]|nr:hypothetical protein [Siculibacillus sp.]